MKVLMKMRRRIKLAIRQPEWISSRKQTNFMFNLLSWEEVASTTTTIINLPETPWLSMDQTWMAWTETGISDFPFWIQISSFRQPDHHWVASPIFNNRGENKGPLPWKDYRSLSQTPEPRVAKPASASPAFSMIESSNTNKFNPNSSNLQNSSNYGGGSNFSLNQVVCNNNFQKQNPDYFYNNSNTLPAPKYGQFNSAVNPYANLPESVDLWTFLMKHFLLSSRPDGIPDINDFDDLWPDLMTPCIL